MYSSDVCAPTSERPIINFWLQRAAQVLTLRGMELSLPASALLFLFLVVAASHGRPLIS